MFKKIKKNLISILFIFLLLGINNNVFAMNMNINNQEIIDNIENILSNEFGIGDQNSGLYIQGEKYSFDKNKKINPINKINKKLKFYGVETLKNNELKGLDINKIHIYKSYYIPYFLERNNVLNKYFSYIEKRKKGYNYVNIYNIGFEDLKSGKLYDMNYIKIIYNSHKHGNIKISQGFVMVIYGSLKKYKLLRIKNVY